MGFFFRKSINFGPLRFNFSKSGIGSSFGVKGARISSGPSGTYIHVGRNGFYYKERIDNFARPVSNQTNPIFGNDSSNDSKAEGPKITTDITSKKLIELINRRIHSEMPTKLVVSICLGVVMLAVSFLVGLLISDSQFSSNISPLVVKILRVGLPTITVVISSFFIFRYFLEYRTSRTSELVYELKDVPLNRFNAISSAFGILIRSKSVWRVGNSVGDSSQPLDVRKEQPPFLQTNVDVWSLDSNRLSAYFLPDYIFVWTNKSYAAISYESLQVNFSKGSYLSTSTPTADATILGYRFQHTRKDGGPDLRYKYNPAFPIVEFGEVTLSSQGGWNLQLQVSNVNAAKSFVEILNRVRVTQGSKGRSSNHSSGKGRTEERNERFNNSQKSSGKKQEFSPEVKTALATLELQIGSTKDEILAAYRGLAKSYHPDKVAQHSPRIAKLAEEKMKEINSAFDILKRNGLA